MLEYSILIIGPKMEENVQIKKHKDYTKSD